MIDKYPPLSGWPSRTRTVHFPTQSSIGHAKQKVKKRQHKKGTKG